MDLIMDLQSGPFRGTAAPTLRLEGVEVDNRGPVGSRA